MKNLEIYCITNKSLPFLEQFSYHLAAVGQESFPSSYLKCDYGDNIFKKEKYYSELTFQYWFWKNKLNVNNDNWVGFCQKRRFWIKKNSENQSINIENYKEHFLVEPPDEWKNYNAIVCKPIFVNRLKRMKLVKRGFKSLIKDPSLFINKKKHTLKLHFDMHHGHGNLAKAIEVMDIKDKSEFSNFVNQAVSYNPHIMFIAKPKIANEWFETLFDWLFKCEKIFGFENLKGYDTQRLYAYLAERYLSFWFNKYAKTLSWPWTLVEK